MTPLSMDGVLALHVADRVLIVPNPSDASQGNVPPSALTGALEIPRTTSPGLCGAQRRCYRVGTHAVPRTSSAEKISEQVGAHLTRLPKSILIGRAGGADDRGRREHLTSWR